MLIGVMGVEMEAPEEVPIEWPVENGDREGAKPSTGNAGLDLGLFGERVVSLMI